jgi:hypothetical protein
VLSLKNGPRGDCCGGCHQPFVICVATGMTSPFRRLTTSLVIAMLSDGILHLSLTSTSSYMIEKWIKFVSICLILINYGYNYQLSK